MKYDDDAIFWDFSLYFFSVMNTSKFRMRRRATKLKHWTNGEILKNWPNCC